MALDDDIRILSGVSLFEELTAEQLRLLAFGAENVSLASGRELYREGAPADCAYVIASGRILIHTERGEERVPLRRLGPASMLGELALIAKTTRLTSAMAEVDTEVIRLNRTLFRRILEEYPETAAALHQRISRDLRGMIASIEALKPRFS